MSTMLQPSVLTNQSNGVAVPSIIGSATPATIIGNTMNTNRSLYVGDLHPDVNEAQLFEKFSKLGTVSSIRVCRDALTHRSLGYAYVNFHRPEDAERAIESTNFEALNNRPIRIMWSQRDPTQRRSTSGNIFIKNLDKRIDVKSLYDTFTLFGKIHSCKIAMDLEGKSKGYGFIHFENEESAQTAIDKVNGMMLDEKKVYVAKFQTRMQRFGDGCDIVNRFTNVYVKNFGDLLTTDEQLKELFAQFGAITSVIIVKDNEGNSRGFGFVAFEKPEDAAKAVDTMNGYELPDSDKKLTVCRAQKKAERQAELKRKYALWKSELEKKCRGANLYVRNLDDNVTDDELRKIFEEFGDISSAKVMRDSSGRSKCFGFVCFASVESAAKAKEEKNGKMHETKPLYVAMAQRKEDRQALLAARYMKNINQMRMQSATTTPAVYTPTGNYYVTQSVQSQPQAAFMSTTVMPQMRTGGAPRWNYMQSYPVQGHQNFHMRSQRSNFRRPLGQPRGVLIGQHRQHYNKMSHVAHIDQPASDQNAIDFNELAKATPMQAKQMIGERLFIKIQQTCLNENAGKITGMLLEMDNSDLLHMLEDASYFKSKTAEAIEVLCKAGDTNNNANSLQQQLSTLPMHPSQV